MVRFECDTCGTLKVDGQDWILGHAAENIGVNSTRREIAFQSSWTDDLATDPLAVHLCCEACRAKFMRRLFGTIPTKSSESQVTRRHVERVVPAAVIEATSNQKKGTSRKKTRSRRSA